MDTIFKGIILSNHPVNFKKVLLESTVIQAATIEEHEENNSPLCHSIFKIIFEIAGKCTDQADLDLIYPVFHIWAKHHEKHLTQFLTTKTLQIYLTDENYSNRAAILTVLHAVLQKISSAYDSYTLLRVLEQQTISLLNTDDNLNIAVPFIRIWMDISLVNIDLVLLSKALIACLSRCHWYDDGKMNSFFIQRVQATSNFIGLLWKELPKDGVKECLTELYAILSSANEQFSPSPCLATLVPYIQEHVLQEMINSVILNKSTTPQILQRVLCRVIDWLAWPSKNVDLVIVNLMKMLEFTKNYTVLIFVTKLKVEQIFFNLYYPLLRESSFPVIMYMLLSYQHSPDVFHKIVIHIPDLLQKLKEENSDSSMKIYTHVAELVHVLIQFHSGFPEVYDPLLQILQEFSESDLQPKKDFMAKQKWGSAGLNYTSSALALQGKSDTGKVGLINLGNTCYMNSILQALYMNDEFRSKVLGQVPTQHQNLLVKLQHVFAFLSFSQRPAYSPKGFLQASRPSWFEAGRQQDCSEFLRFFFDTMHEQECQLSPNDTLPSSRGSRNSDDDKGNETHNILINNCVSRIKGTDDNECGSYRCLIHELFGGELTVSYKCFTCQQISTQKEGFIDLSLALPECQDEAKYIQRKELRAGRAEENVDITIMDGPSDLCASNQEVSSENVSSASLEQDLQLEDLIHYYISPEKLEGENRYHCSNCDTLQEAQKTISISSAPKYLTLTLLRFAYDIQTRQRVKILRNIIYPEVLSIPVAPCEGEKAEKCSKFDLNHVYLLYAVVVHSGASSDCGHYYTYACHSDNLPQRFAGETENFSTQNRLWYLFNDSRVTSADYKSFSNLSQRFARDTAYLLFYRKVDPKEISQLRASKDNGHVNLRRDLMDAVEQDNLDYIQELDDEIRESRKQASDKPTSHWKDSDDHNPPGGCGDGNGMGGLHSLSIRFVC